MNLYSRVTGQGTAMADATLCDACLGDIPARMAADAAADAADDARGASRVWVLSTGNDQLSCVECGWGPR
ncbi:hypothetical protein H7J07_05525 [Mycobacterium koreense]|nr:hypothetical protein [Mycolicibacillus koreensis]MCV7247684.1 hypothetical protein [Mycolicibacillus koreensis]BBY54069.1 hypothetical protein MKOR_13200 [Mycolicibacillus koreensis]